MARRFIAVLGIFAIVILALLLIWRVYLHHRAGGDEDDGPGVIASAARPHRGGRVAQALVNQSYDLQRAHIHDDDRRSTVDRHRHRRPDELRASGD